MDQGRQTTLKGEAVVSTLEVTEAVVAGFADFSRDRNPLHMEVGAARSLGFRRRVAHGGILIAEVSRIIGMQLPGPGALWLDSEFEFAAPVFVGDTVEVRVSVVHHSIAVGVVVLDILATNQSGTPVLKGSAKVKLLEGVMPLTYKPLVEQTVVVTGGTRGLGGATAAHLADRGAHVIALFRGDIHRAKVFQDSLDAKVEGRVQTVQCDVRDSSNVADLFDSLQGQGLTPTSIVHAASPILQDIALGELQWSDVHGFLETYVGGALNLIKHATPGFETAPGGRFVAIGSEAVTAPRKGWLHYVTAKSAFLGMVRGLAVELAPLGATANLVSPGLLNTSEALPESVKSATRRATPLGRLATDEEVAATIAFLLEAGGSFMSGADLPLFGGRVFG